MKVKISLCFRDESQVTCITHPRLCQTPPPMFHVLPGPRMTRRAVSLLVGPIEGVRKESEAGDQVLSVGKVREI